jgi:hypothetical protein
MIAMGIAGRKRKPMRRLVNKPAPAKGELPDFVGDRNQRRTKARIMAISSKIFSDEEAGARKADEADRLKGSRFKARISRLL